MLNDEHLTTCLSFEQATYLVVERAKQLVSVLIEARGHDKPPFSSREYADLKGIKPVVPSDLGKELSAILLRFSDGYVVEVNEKHHPSRQHFSFAHELGHILVSELGLESRLENVEFRTFNPQAQSNARAKAKERLCDIAAAELLMPESVFKRYLSDFGISALSIERLARLFEASIPTTALRIAEVSPEPCMALLWKHQPKSRSKGLRLDWCIGPGRNLTGKSRHTPAYTVAPSTSTLYEAYQGDNVVKCHRLFKTGKIGKSLRMESKGFGYDERRYVISLAFLGQQVATNG